jgi:serine/arginine repetitive matrix protein 2
MVRKKKSRAALDEVGWGAGSNVDEKANVPKKDKENVSLKPKLDEKGGWWSIGRGRKDSKEKKEKGDREHSKTRAKCKSSLVIFLLG